MNHTSEMNPFVQPGGPTDTLHNSSDQRTCRRALGLGGNDPVVVNFFTYNESCQGFSLTPMFAAIWSHEGFGTHDPLNPATANGHEARRRIAARDTLNDPYRVLEPVVQTTMPWLTALVGQRVHAIDAMISSFANEHEFVKDNYVQNGGKCGDTWVFDSTYSRYYKISLTQLVNGQFECL